MPYKLKIGIGALTTQIVWREQILYMHKSCDSLLLGAMEPLHMEKKKALFYS